MGRINQTGLNTKPLPPQSALLPGKTITAQVLKLEGNQVLLQWGSSLLLAKTRLRLRRGDRLQLRVESNAAGLIKLKILNDGDKQIEGPRLQRRGIPSQKGLETIVRQFLKFSLPVNPDAVREMSRLILKYKLNNELSGLIVWLKSVGVEVASEKDLKALEDLRRFFRGELAGEEEGRFFRFINETEKTPLGGYNIYGWPLGENHIYLLTPRSKSGAARAENSCLILKIGSQALQELWFKLETVNKRLRVEIICKSDKHRLILDRELPLLQAALKGAGYPVPELAVQVFAVEKLFDLLPDAEPELMPVNLEV